MEKSCRMEGFSLLELLITIAISSVFLVGIVSLLVTQLQAFRLQQAIAMMQENARMSSSLLRRDIGMASDIGYAAFQQDTLTIQRIFNGDLSHFVYYVAKTHRRNTVGNSIYALYRSDLTKSGVPAEMVEGVEKMQIRYGIQVDKNSHVQYVLASQVSDWQKVVSVDITLLLNSIEAVARRPQRYFFQKQWHMAKDRLLRREWRVFIVLRERIK